MRITVSLDDELVIKAKELAAEHGVGDSGLVEASLRDFMMQSKEKRDATIRQFNIGKRRLTRNGWLRLFWEVLAAEFGTTDTSGEVVVDMPRRYGDFDILVFPLRPDDNPNEILMHTMESGLPVGAATYTGKLFPWSLEQSVYDAAREVATWVNEKTEIRGKAQQLKKGGIYEDADGQRYTIEETPEIDMSGVVLVRFSSGESREYNTWDFASRVVRQVTKS